MTLLKNIYFLCFLFYFFTIPIYAQQSINGRWVGTITQTGANKVASSYYFELNIRQDSTHKQITGTSYSYLRNSEGKYALKATLQGSFKDNTLIFNELSAIEYENTIAKKSDYCVKNATLNFVAKENKLILEGQWQGNEHKSVNPCAGGTILLEKYVADTTQDIKYSEETIVSVQNRKVKKGKTIVVHNTTLKIEIFDDAEEDDDVISLNFNGKWLVKNHKLRNKPLLRTILINPTSPFNFITTFAHNLGKMPPNTTAIIVDDGKKKQKFVLKSDLEDSDILYIEYEK
jgi:hypothetical protein